MNKKHFKNDDKSYKSSTLTGQNMSLRPPDDGGGDPPIDPPPGGSSVSLNQVSPLAGAIAGGISITLTGSGFQTGAAVYFGNAPAAQVTVDSGEVIRAVSPSASAAGSVAVSVVNPDGSSATMPGGFTYVTPENGQQAEVIGISPLAVIEDTNTVVTIRGRNLIAAYNDGLLALRGPSRCQITFLGTTTNYDAASGIDTVQMNVNIKCVPGLQPLERMAVQVLASRRAEAANDGVVESSRQMFTVLPKAVPVTLAYTANLDPSKPSLVMVSGRNLDGHSLALNDGTEIAFQKNDGNFISGIVNLPENVDTSSPLQMSMLDSGGTKVAEYQMEVAPDSGFVSLNSEQNYASLAQSPDELSVNFTPAPNQQFIGPTANDSAAFSVSSGSPFGFGFNWGNFAITIVDVTIILPIVNEVYLIPFFDGGGDIDSPVLAEVGKIFRLRGAGLLVAIRVEVRIHIQVVLIIGFYYQIWDYGFYNEFPEFGWSIGSMVIGIEINIEILFSISLIAAIVQPNGQLYLIAKVNLEIDIDFSIDSNGHLHFDPQFTHSVNIIGINPAPNNPMPCGNKFELLPQNGLTAVPDLYGFVAQYAVHEAGDCCLPWDFNVRLLRFRSNGQQEVVQEGFQTSYCLTAIEPPKVKVELALAYKDLAGNIVKVDDLHRDEPDTDPVKLREYFLAASFDFQSATPTFPVNVKVKVDSASLSVTPPFPRETFGTKNVNSNNYDTAFDRTQGTKIEQFFKGTLLQKDFEAELTLNNMPVNNQSYKEYVIFPNAKIVPNRVEVAQGNQVVEYVPPGPKVTAHLLAACQTTDKNSQNDDTTCRRKVGVKLAFKDLSITETNNNSSLTPNPQSLSIESHIVNEETYEEYFRVFYEVRKLMEDGVGRSGTGTLGTFARELMNDLPQSGPLIGTDILKEKGTKLWELGYNYVQGGKKDDRILYFARLEAMAVLRNLQNRNRTAQTLSQNELNMFEYHSRGLKTETGTDAKIEFSNSDSKKVVVTGFDPFLLGKNGLVSNPSGIVALDFYNNSQKFTTAEVRTAIFPVRYEDFGNSGKGIVEKVMEEAVKTASLIMTSSRGDTFYDVDRFATRTRTNTTYDNLQLKSVTTNPTESPGNPSPFFIESTLPYTSVISNTKKQNFAGPKGNDSTPFVMNQSYKQANKSHDYPSGGFSDPDSYTKSNDLPDKTQEVIDGSGGTYLSNEIFYRTAKTRENNREGLPTGHLHLPIIDFSTTSNVKAEGNNVVNDVSEILKEFMNYSLEIVYPETLKNSTGVTKTATLTNFVAPNNRMQSVPAIRITSVEIFPTNLQPNFQVATPLPIDITSGASEDIEIKFIPTEVKDYVAIAKLKDSNGVTLFTISLKGRGINPQPRITSFSPTSGSDGTVVTILGENFIGTTDVRIGDSIYFDVISPNRIDAYIDEYAFTSFIEVVTPNGTAISSTAFVVIRYRNPRDPNDPIYE